MEQYDRERKLASQKLNAWVYEYEQKLALENKTLPTKKILKQIMIENANELYTKYSESSSQLKISIEYIDSALHAGNITRAGFDHLAHKNGMIRQHKNKKK